MEIEDTAEIPLESTRTLLLRTQESISYLRVLHNQQKAIEQFLQSTIQSSTENNDLSPEDLNECKIQLKWFKTFLDNFSEDDTYITAEHINTQNNIFIQFQDYLKDTKHSRLSLDIKSLKNLPLTHFTERSSQNTSNICCYDALQFQIAISTLVTYLYFYFLTKHREVYLTPDMNNPENSLINIVSVAHIDYIILIFEGTGDTDQPLQEQSEEQLKVFGADVANWNDQVDSFEDFLGTMNMIAYLDTQLTNNIRSCEQLYGLFLAKRQTAELCLLEKQKLTMLQAIWKQIINEAIFSTSIANNRQISQKQPSAISNFSSQQASASRGGGAPVTSSQSSFNTGYLLPYSSLLQLCLSEFSLASSDSILSRDNSAAAPLFQMIYDECFTALNKLYTANASTMAALSTNPTKQNTNLTEELKLKQGQLQRCMTLVQETTIVNPTFLGPFEKLAQDLFIAIE